MNDEIKEILDNLKDEVWSKTGADSYDKLLNYITNLQQENQDLSRMCELYGKSLYNAELTDYKSRIEKAVEYIKKHIEKCNIDGYEGKFDNFDIFTKPQKILNILNGRSDE